MPFTPIAAALGFATELLKLLQLPENAPVRAAGATQITTIMNWFTEHIQGNPVLQVPKPPN